jgi:hypothetical protein
MSKTHWKSLINPDYLGAYSLGDLGELTVTIDYVQTEEITGSQGKKEYCTVARMVGEKPMILNVTNSKSIGKLYGPFIEDWVGKQITLYTTTTKMAGEVVECLRIRPKVTKIERRAITDKGLARAIAAIKDGTFTTVQLHQEYALTEEQQSTVTEALSETAS